MTNFTTPDTARPWWADVAQERERRERSAFVGDTPSPRPRASREPAPRTRRHVATPATPRPRSAAHAPARATRPDWFADEARAAGRVQTPRAEARTPQRPRATLVDVTPLHVAPRAKQERRAPGERPTVTITGRPDAALPPQVSAPALARSERARGHAYSLVASPDRLILWAVVLGLLMIVASVGTADAAIALR